MRKPVIITAALLLVIIGYFLRPKKDIQDVNNSPPTVLDEDILEQASIQKCDGIPTPNQPAGPYFKTNSPNRNRIAEPSNPINRLVVEGVVYSQNCKPILGALIDFWQAGEDGEYDNIGFNLRGHQFTDEKGEYSLETVIPAMYSSRPPHIHVKIQTSMDKPVFTSQLYFPENSESTSDTLFNDKLVVNLEKTTKGKIGIFNFVIPN